MDLDEFSRQLELMHARFMQLCPTNGTARGDLRSMWEETSEALGVTMEEMRVAEEELRQQSDELEESRRAVEAERQRYRDLFDFAPDGYLVTDLAGVIREANRAAGELLGVAPRYLERKPLASYVAMEDRAAFRGGLNRLLRVGRREDWIVRMQPRRGGRVRRVDHGGRGPRLGRDAVGAAVDGPRGGGPGRRANGRPGSHATGRVRIGLADDSVPAEAQSEHQGRIRAEDEAAALRGSSTAST